MKQGLMDKEVTMQDGTDVGTVKDVIVTLDPKNVTLVVSRGLGKGQTEIPWSQIVSVEDRIVIEGGTTAAEQEMAGKAETSNGGTVKILFYSDCPHVAQTTQDVKAVLDEEGLTADIQLVDLARAPDIEKEMPYAGSPTILVDGLDIAPPGDEFTGPESGSCRLYEYEGREYDHPPKELIRQALTRGRRKGKAQEVPTGQPREREGEIVGDGEMPGAPEHDLDYRQTPPAAGTAAAEPTARKEPASGVMPAAPEHDLDYHGEGEAAQQPQRSVRTSAANAKQ